MKSIIEEAYSLLVAEIPWIQSNGEIVSESSYGTTLTITFPNLNPEEAIVREYYNGIEPYTYQEYVRGQSHGKYISWWKNGQRNCERWYYEGKFHGKNLGWHYDGAKMWDCEYSHGKQISEKYYP